MKKQLSEQTISKMKDKETYVPLHMREGYMNYFNNGVKTGGFGMAVINEDLDYAYRKADYTNSQHVESQIAWVKIAKEDIESGYRVKSVYK